MTVDVEKMLVVFKKKRLARWAAQCGFIRRRRGISAVEFLVMMTYGLVGMHHPSLAAMVDGIKARISREALHQRFTDKAVAFMNTCVNYLLCHTLAEGLRISSALLNHFPRIHLVDSTAWAVNAALKGVFAGSGGSASEAACKLQVCYEYRQGALSFFELGPGNQPDSAWAKALPALPAPGDLLITDLGYFCLRALQQIAANGAFFLSRFLIGTALVDAATSTPINLCALLRATTMDAFEMQVLMGGTDAKAKLCARLICLRVNDAVAAARRAKLIKNVRRKKNRAPDPDRLYLCGWVLMVTNVPAQWISADMVRPFYSLRWQIELLFKQLKSVLAIEHTDSAKEPRLRCELLGRLIVAILTHQVHAALNASLWNTTSQEVSMDKLHKRLQERAFVIKDLLLLSVKKAAKYLNQELPALLKNCRKLHQKSRPSTLQILNSPRPASIPCVAAPCLT